MFWANIQHFRATNKRIPSKESILVFQQSLEVHVRGQHSAYRAIGSAQRDRPGW
jgi:hypothetical protein